MKGLAWFTAIVTGLYELYFLSEVISSYDTFLWLFCMALFAPMMVFAILFLKNSK